MAAELRIIGIDPGTRHMGWGVIRRHGSRMIHVAHGVIDTVPGAPIPDRLVQIFSALEEVLGKTMPTESAIEALFFAKDAQAAAKLGHARGVAMLVMARAGLPIAEYPPASVKRAVAGRGAAGKGQVGKVVQAILALPEVPREDAADALAVAITHAQIASFQRTLAAAQSRT